MKKALLIIKFILTTSSATASIIKGEVIFNNESCQQCLVVFEKDTNSYKQTYTDINGQFEQSLNTEGEYQATVFNNGNQSQPITVNTDKSELFLRMNAVEARSSLNKFRIKKIVSSSDYKKLVISNAEKNIQMSIDFSNLDTQQGQVDVAFPFNINDWKINYISAKPGYVLNMQSELDLSLAKINKDIDLESFNSCYQAMTKITQIRKPKSVVDFSQLTDGEPVIFQDVDGDLMLLKEDEVFNYGPLKTVTSMKFTEGRSIASVSSQSPVFMYPPGDEDQKIYFISGRGGNMKLSTKPKGSYGTKWVEVSEVQQNKSFDEKFKVQFLKLRGHELRLINHFAQQDLAGLKEVDTKAYSKAISELRNVSESCEDLQFDKTFAQNAEIYKWQTEIKKLNLTLNTPSENNPLKNQEGHSVASLDSGP